MTSGSVLRANQRVCWPEHRWRAGVAGCSLVLAGASLGCAVQEPRSEQERGATLEQGVVAQVGPDRIDALTVQRIASAQQLPLAEARSRAIFDAE